MAVQTYSANATAQAASKATGRTITAKMVRTMARSTMAAYDKAAHPDYQSHAYTAKVRDTLVARFVAQGERRSAQDSASGRKAAKAAIVARKSARTAKVAAQVAPDATV